VYPRRHTEEHGVGRHTRVMLNITGMCKGALLAESYTVSVDEKM
jgi:hypothetical protein